MKKKTLHSTMVLLKLNLDSRVALRCSTLHSTMVLLKPFPALLFQAR